MKLASSRKMRRQHWLLLTLLASAGMSALGVYVWRIQLPNMPATLREAFVPHLRVVATWKNVLDARVTPLGVLCVSAPTETTREYTQYGFSNERRWAVRVTKYRPLTARPLKEYPFATSPNGHIFAVATIEEHYPTIRTYRDGKLLGITRIPRTPRIGAMSPVELAVLNSGQVWALPHTDMDLSPTWDRRPAFPVYLVEGKQIFTGWYQIRTPLQKTNFGYSQYLAPDGAMLMAGFQHLTEKKHTLEVVALRFENSRVVCEHRRTFQTNKDISVFPGGRYTQDFTTVYNLDGLLHAPILAGKPLPWQPHTLKSENAVMQWTDKGQRILNVQTGKSWMLPVTNYMPEYPLLSANGRFIAKLTAKQRNRHVKPFTMNGLYSERAVLSVYEQPGALRASSAGIIDRLSFWSPDGRIRLKAISPDGRYVLFNSYPLHPDEYTLYHW